MVALVAAGNFAVALVCWRVVVHRRRTRLVRGAVAAAGLRV
jgi:hypothetical protein